MKRFGVNWWGIFAANLAFYGAIVACILPPFNALWAYLNDFMNYPRPQPDLMTPFLIVLNAGFITVAEYREFVRGESSGKSAEERRATSRGVGEISWGKLIRWWLKGTSLVGVPYALLHFFTGWPSVLYVLFATLVIPALFIFGLAAKRYFYLSGVLNRTTEIPVNVSSTTPAIAPSVTKPVPENAFVSVGNRGKP